MATLTTPFAGGSGLPGGNYGQATPGNYMDVYGFDNAPENTNLPAIYEREVQRYGKRNIMKMLRMLGAENAVNSQRIRWAEQRRLHISYNRVRRANATAEDFIIYQNDTTVVTTGNTATNLTNHSVRVNDKVLIGDSNTTHLAIVSAVSGSTVTLRSFVETSADAGFAGLDSGVTDLILLVVGSEFNKGSDSRDVVIQPQYDSYINDTVILRDTYSINGSDGNQVGWVEAITEDGAMGKYWYAKGKSEARIRFEDYVETALLEDKAADIGSNANTAVTDELGAVSGSEGLFDAITTRGNVAAGGFAETQSGFITDLDNILKRFDVEGNIEENMFYLDRTESLAWDNGLAAQNSGQVNGVGGTSWGMFNNSKDMAITLGFNGCRRGSYDFYKTDWDYLNKADGRGPFSGVKGISVPVGSTSVYDKMHGGSMLSSLQPFLNVKYLAGPLQNRSMVSWIHGAVGGNPTSGLDAMIVELLSERCLCTHAANNFFLFT